MATKAVYLPLSPSAHGAKAHGPGIELFLNITPQAECRGSYVPGYMCLSFTEGSRPPPFSGIFQKCNVSGPLTAAVDFCRNITFMKPWLQGKGKELSVVMS
jgi:hypothetical protein